MYQADKELARPYPRCAGKVGNHRFPGVVFLPADFTSQKYGFLGVSHCRCKSRGFIPFLDANNHRIVTNAPFDTAAFLAYLFYCLHRRMVCSMVWHPASNEQVNFHYKFSFLEMS